MLNSYKWSDVSEDPGVALCANIGYMQVHPPFFIRELSIQGFWCAQGSSADTNGQL